MNKKGNAAIETLMIIIVLFVLGIIVFMEYKSLDDIYLPLYNDLDSTDAKQVLDDTHSRYPSIFDGIFIFAFVLLWAAGIVSILIKDDHPILFGFMMIILFAVIFVGILLGNTFEETFEDSEYNSLSITFPKTFYIMSHMLPIGIVIAFSILLIYMAKNKL